MLFNLTWKQEKSSFTVGQHAKVLCVSQLWDLTQKGFSQQIFVFSGFLPGSRKLPSNPSITLRSELRCSDLATLYVNYIHWWNSLLAIKKSVCFTWWQLLYCSKLFEELLKTWNLDQVYSLNDSLSYLWLVESCAVVLKLDFKRALNAKSCLLSMIESWKLFGFPFNS